MVIFARLVELFVEKGRRGQYGTSGVKYNMVARVFLKSTLITIHVKWRAQKFSLVNVKG